MKIYWAGSVNLGNEQEGVDWFLARHFKQRLLSYAYLNDLKQYANVVWQVGEFDQHLIIDSGAFSAWSKGDVIDIDNYIQYVQAFLAENSFLFDSIYVVNLDIIPGSNGIVPTAKQRDQCALQGLKNLDKMLDHFSSDMLIHVFHMYEDFSIIDEILKRVNYIGVSPANDVNQATKFKWMQHVFDYLPKCKTHGFAVTAIDSIMEFPWYSVDSTAPILTGATGGIYTPYGKFVVSEKNKKNILQQPDHIKINILKYIEEIGFTYDELAKSHINRFIANAKYLIKLQSELNEKSKDKYVKEQYSLF